MSRISKGRFKMQNSEKDVSIALADDSTKNGARRIVGVRDTAESVKPIDPVIDAYTKITQIEEPRSTSAKQVRAQYMTAARTLRDVYAEKTSIMQGTTAEQRAALQDRTLAGISAIGSLVSWLADLPSGAKIDPIQIGSVVRLTSRGTGYHAERYHGKGVVISRSDDGASLTVRFGKGDDATQSVERKHLESYLSADKSWSDTFAAFGIDPKIR
jgi:hypothetical protein